MLVYPSSGQQYFPLGHATHTLSDPATYPIGQGLGTIDPTGQVINAVHATGVTVPVF